MKCKHLLLLTLILSQSMSLWGMNIERDGLGSDQENKWVKIVQIMEDPSEGMDPSYGLMVPKALDSWDKESDRVGKYALHPPSHPDYDHQLWMFRPAGNGYYTIFSKYAEKNLDSWDKESDRVGKYALHPPSHPDYDHQLWKIKFTGGPYIRPSYTIISKYSGKELAYGDDNDNQVGKEIHGYGWEIR